MCEAWSTRKSLPAKTAYKYSSRHFLQCMLSSNWNPTGVFALQMRAEREYQSAICNFPFCSPLRLRVGERNSRSFVKFCLVLANEHRTWIRVRCWYFQAFTPSLTYFSVFSHLKAKFSAFPSFSMSSSRICWSGGLLFSVFLLLLDFGIEPREVAYYRIDTYPRSDNIRRSDRPIVIIPLSPHNILGLEFWSWGWSWSLRLVLSSPSQLELRMHTRGEKEEEKWLTTGS